MNKNDKDSGIGVFTIGNISALKGEKTQGYLNVCSSELKMPLTLIHGAKPGKTVVITAGIHGGEYPGIEASIRLASMLKPEDLSGRIAIVHPVNTGAFAAKLQYVGPEDGKNLNRMFPGKATGTTSERIAYTIVSELFSKADFYIDLHGGDIHEALVPFVLYSLAGTKEVSRVSEEAASRMGLPYVVGSVSTTGTFGSAALLGVPGFLAEIGQCGLWTEQEVLTYISGVKNVLAYLGLLSQECVETKNLTKLPKMIGTAAEQSGCWYPSVKPGDVVKKGQSLGEIRDFFSNKLGEYRATQDGTVLYVASSLAINSGDPVAAIG